MDDINKRLTEIESTIAVAYLARGTESGWEEAYRYFFESYRDHQAGLDHKLYILFKGFEDNGRPKTAMKWFPDISVTPVYLPNTGFDIGTYIAWANRAPEDYICVFNSSSVILAEHWLKKLTANLLFPNVGLVGASGSYESLAGVYDGFPPFPNIHLRSNGFMMDRRLFAALSEHVDIKDKIDAYRFESGVASLTRQVIGLGKEVRVVGRNGRGYPPEHWPVSDTFRQGIQTNLLVEDNQTRLYMSLPWLRKKEVVKSTWGKYINERKKISTY